MKGKIRFKYDNGIKGYIVNFPEFIHMSSIDEWIVEFGLELEYFSPKKRVVMLVNTNRHDFESIQCLKKLRLFFCDIQFFYQAALKELLYHPQNHAVKFRLLLT